MEYVNKDMDGCLKGIEFSYMQGNAYMHAIIIIQKRRKWYNDTIQVMNVHLKNIFTLFYANVAFLKNTQYDLKESTMWLDNKLIANTFRISQIYHGYLIFNLINIQICQQKLRIILSNAFSK